MFGDYYTNDLLGSTADLDVRQPDRQRRDAGGRGPEAGSLVIILMVIVIVPMLYYLRETKRAAEAG